MQKIDFVSFLFMYPSESHYTDLLSFFVDLFNIALAIPFIFLFSLFLLGRYVKEEYAHSNFSFRRLITVGWFYAFLAMLLIGVILTFIYALFFIK